MAKNNLKRGAIVEALKKVTDDIKEIPNDAVSLIFFLNIKSKYLSSTLGK
jgi:hypothetical protein